MTNNPNKTQKIYLCAFANLNLSTSAYRFYHQALNMGIFENIFIYNECSLDLDFVKKFKNRFYEEVKYDANLSNGGGDLKISLLVVVDMILILWEINSLK